MSFFELLILLMFFLLPAISRLLERRKQPSAPPPQRDRRTQPRPDRPGVEPVELEDEEDPLADALRQIREALGQPEVAAEPAPRAESEPPMDASPAGETYTKPYASPHYRQPEPSVSGRPERTPGAPPVEALSVRRPPMRVETPARRPSDAARLVGNLSDPDEAKRAFLLKEVLDERGGIARRRR